MKISLDAPSRATDAPRSRKRLSPRWIPLGIGLGFALLFLALFRDRLLPARNVEVAVVLAGPEVAGEEPDREAEGARDVPPGDAPMVFQASGWIEPDPFPVEATALVDGVIDEVHVLEGERVEEGQLLASLVRKDFELTLDAARQALRMRESEHAAHRESIRAAERTVAAEQAELEAAAALVEETEDRWRRVEGLSGGAISASEVVTIRSAHRRARAVANAARAELEREQAEVERLRAHLAVGEAAVAAATVEVKAAELALSRTRITAPMSGRVLRLRAAPGEKKRLAMDDHYSATVAVLYDPQRLQARVDVPLADAAGLRVGQRARMWCSVLPDTVFHGEVTRITGEADVQRNTLQAKVRIEAPDAILRPEMLCRVEFLRQGATSADPSGNATGTLGTLTTWVPASSLAGDHAWVCDPDRKRLERRMLSGGGETRDGYVRIHEGLRPGEWVVLAPDGLEEGQRVNPQLIEP